MTATRYLSSKQFNPLPNNEFTITIANPLDDNYEGLPPKGTILPGNPNDEDPAQHAPMGPNCVLSIQPGGGFQVRAEGTKGGYERAIRDGGFGNIEPTPGEVYQIPIATSRS